MIIEGSAAESRSIRYSALRNAMFVCFLFSGASGLVYEVVWTRMLILIFGATTFAISTVLTAFMAGLALGSYAAGRWVDRRSRPIYVYGALELCIGLYALAVPVLFAGLTPVYKAIWQQFAPEFYVFSLIRFVAVSAVLIVPTFFMGATLPVLGRFCARSRELIGTDVGTLYAVNTFGAVLGAFGAGFILIPLAGERATMVLAAGVNIAIGALALALGSRLPADEAVAARQDEADSSASESGRGSLVWVTMCAFALSGFAAMGYEVAWSRTLSLVIGSSVYAISIMLTTFLTGLALGGMVAARMLSRLGSYAPTLIVAVQVVVGACAYGVAHMLGELPYYFAVLFQWFAKYGYWELTALEFVIAGAVMFVPTVLLGAMFPLAVRVCAPTVRGLGKSVGAVYATNTVGAIVGSFMAGWVLIPAVGILRTIVLCATVNVAAGLLVACAPRARVPLRFSLALGSMSLVVAMWIEPPKWNPLVITSGMYKYAADIKDCHISKQQFVRRVAGKYDLLFYKEGLTTTVTVGKGAITGNIWMATNGKIDASSGPDMPTQILSGHLPLLLMPQAKDLLVVGYASGITVGATTTYPIRKVTVVEIEKAVIEGSRFFNNVNHNPLADTRRVELVIDDARNYMLVTDRKFDVIISEPSNPWISGASNLFTQEYFRLGKARLREGGVFAQWLQLYGMAQDDLRSLFATYCSVFDHVLVFETIEATDLVLLGSRRPLSIDVEQLAERMAQPDVHADLDRIGIDDVSALLSYFLMGTQEIRAFTANARLNTDNNGLIEFSSPKHLHENSQIANALALDRVLGTVQPYLVNYGNTPQARALMLAAIAQQCHRRELEPRALRLAKAAIALSDVPQVRKFLAGIPPPPISTNTAAPRRQEP